MIVEFKNTTLAESAATIARKNGYIVDISENTLMFKSIEDMEDFLLDIDVDAYQLDNGIQTNLPIKESMDEMASLRKLSGVKIIPVQHTQPSLRNMKNMIEQFEDDSLEEKSLGALIKQTVNPLFNKDVFEKAKQEYTELIKRGAKQGLAITKAANEFGLSPREFQNWLLAHGIVEGLEHGYDDIMRQIMRITESTWRTHPDMPKKTVFETVLNNGRLQGSITENNMNDWLIETRNIDLNVWLNV